MDNKLLLINCITLLYRESQIENATQNSAEIVREQVDQITLPEISVGEFGTERDLLASLKHICLDMCSKDPSHKYVSIELLQKIRHAVRDEDFLYNSFKDGIESELNEEDLNKFVKNLRISIKESSQEKEIAKCIQEAAYNLKFKRDTIKDFRSYIRDVVAKLDTVQVYADKVDPAVVASVNMSDIDAIADVFKMTKELNDERGIMKTGWQCVNRMTQGGFRRGEFIVLGALQHNFKTGFTLSLFKHIAQYNKPYMLDPKKKPALIRITFEDPLTLNIPFLYRNIVENETLQPANIMNCDPVEMARYVSEKLSVNGYNIFLKHVNPSEWTYLDVINYILELESQGYEVHLCMLDYLAMLPTTGCIQTGPTGAAMRDLYRRMRNFMSSKKITCITPHQLSTEAKMLIRSGLEETFLREVANRGYYDGCRTIDQEVDMELYIHKVIADGKSFLTIQRGKHRLVVQTLERYKSAVLPFHDVGDIRDDIMGPDSALKRPGGPPLTSEENNTFWSFES